MYRVPSLPPLTWSVLWTSWQMLFQLHHIAMNLRALVSMLCSLFILTSHLPLLSFSMELGRKLRSACAEELYASQAGHASLWLKWEMRKKIRGKITISTFRSSHLGRDHVNRSHSRRPAMATTLELIQSTTAEVSKHSSYCVISHVNDSCNCNWEFPDTFILKI